MILSVTVLSRRRWQRRLATPAVAPTGESQNTGGLVSLGTLAVRSAAISAVQRELQTTAAPAEAIAQLAGRQVGENAQAMAGTAVPDGAAVGGDTEPGARRQVCGVSDRGL